MFINKKIIYSILFFFVLTSKSFAYIGPGLSGGVLALVFGLFISIFGLFFGIIYFPIKRFLKRKKTEKSRKKQKLD